MTETSLLGWEILSLSIKSFIKLYGDTFELMVLCNNTLCDKADLYNAKVVDQDANDFPLGNGILV